VKFQNWTQKENGKKDLQINHCSMIETLKNEMSAMERTNGSEE
jgi:hypothetical protein